MLFPFQLQCRCFENKMGKAVNPSGSRPCSPAAAAPPAPTPARGAAARGSTTAWAVLPVPSRRGCVLIWEHWLRLQRQLCHRALLTAAAPAGAAQLRSGAAGGAAAWDWHSGQVPHALLGPRRASPSPQALSPMCGCIPGDSGGAAPRFVSGSRCPPAQREGKAKLPPCPHPAAWAGAGGERGRTGPWIRLGLRQLWAPASHASCNFTCTCPQAAGDKHGATALYVACDLSSARVCLAPRVSREW